jgi:hypothetical protein
MHRTLSDLKLLQNQSTFRHVSVAAKTTIREGSPFKLEQCLYKTLFVLSCTGSKVHLTTFMDVKTW